MKKLLVTTIFLLLTTKVFAGPIIEVEGNLYEMDTVTGVLSSHRLTIESQVWFGDDDLARVFANTVGTQISSPFNWGLGPAFGFNIYDGPLADYTTSWFYKSTNHHLAVDNRAQVQNAAAGVYASARQGVASPGRGAGSWTALPRTDAEAPPPAG